jgi:predicted PP-loop superfamily ATPase
MRNIYDVIRQKESQIQDIQKELEALRLAARLLSDEEKAEIDAPKVRVAASAAAVSASPMKADSEILLSAPRRPFP